MLQIRVYEEKNAITKKFGVKYDSKTYKQGHDIYQQTSSVTHNRSRTQ